MRQKFTIGYFYPNHLNLYGDNGNVEVLYSRGISRDFDVRVKLINPDTSVDSALMNSVDLVFMGGGPDALQKEVFTDFLTNKGPFLKEYIDNGGSGLFICGSYQLCGNFYKAADGSILQGLGMFNIYTEHFGSAKPRCIGTTVCSFADWLLEDPYRNMIEATSSKPHLVGFENHGGRTYLESGVTPLGKIIKGHGNNSEDKTEGAVYKNAFGTYFHGPVLALNPHFADFLIAKSLKLDNLTFMYDKLSENAHNLRL